MKEVYRAFLPSMKKYRWLFVWATILMVLGVTTKAIYPFFLRMILDAFGAGDSGPVLERALLYIAITFVGTHVIWFWYDMMISWFESKVMRDLDCRSFAAVIGQSMRFFENAFAGSLVKSANRFRHAFEFIADAYFYQLGRSLTLMVITLIIFAMEQPVLALVFAAWAGLFILFNVKTAKIRYRLSKEEADADSACGGAFADAFGNAATIKSFGREHEEEARFAGYVETCYQKRLKAWFSSICIMRGQGFLMSGLEFVLIWWLVRGWRAGTVTVGDFVLFQTYVILLIQQLWDFGSQLHRVYQHTADAKEMADIMAKPPEVRDVVAATCLEIAQPRIDIRAATFSYLKDSPGGRKTIDRLDLAIKPGEKVALVGRSGGGKTTIAKLLLRLYDLQGGIIRIDGQDIALAKQQCLRRQVALVSQMPELFHRSIRDNIRFARPGATDEEVTKAAERAHAMEFISKLPHGLDTLVGERGVKLSGGERQRVSLARAFLADTRIVILDEATSALDSATEALIQDAIKDLMHGRTVLAIAHRLSTIMDSDRIVVLEAGRVVEEGSHFHLLEQAGVYAELWNHQSGGYIAE